MKKEKGDIEKWLGKEAMSADRSEDEGKGAHKK